jgi:deazaflavin-dependent oxidoreductase (nitroreductase family)
MSVGGISSNGTSGRPDTPAVRLSATFDRLRTRAFKAFAKRHTRLLVRTKGRPSRTGWRIRFLVLETRSRRSGASHSIVLLYMPDPRGHIVMASNFGSEHPPGWWLNLEAHPEARVHLSGRTTEVRVRVLTGEERAEAAARGTRYNAQWRRYLTTLRREIPIVLLEPAPTESPS